MSDGLRENRAISWRPSENLLAWAFIASFFVHVIAYGTYLTGHHLGWWKKDLRPNWLKSTQQILAQAKLKQLQPQQPHEVPMVFVEVDPATATTEAPKNATHYSSHNSRADNTDAQLESELAKIDGRQTHVAKTMTANKNNQQFPLQPSPRPPQPKAEPEPKPNGGKPPGDLAFNKSYPTPGENPSEQKPTQSEPEVHRRPTTLAEAKMQKALEGEKMKQEGGVKPRLRLDSLDAIATPFGEYDRELIDAIQSHWDDLLMSKEFTHERTGKVVVDFVLNYDGSISDLHVVDANVGDLLSAVCQLAIRDPAPFRPWPPEMRRMMGDHRDVRFTFYYE